MSVLFKDKITGLWRRAAANLIYASFPVGSIVAYGGSSDADAPAGCMYCHGQALNSADYPELYDVIGTKFGVGDGSAGSFSLPELRGEFLRGAGTNQHSGQGSGGLVGAHQDATATAYSYSNGSSYAVAASTHPINHDSLVNIPSVNGKYLAPQGTYNTHAAYNDFRTVRPTNTSVEYIIKVVK